MKRTSPLFWGAGSLSWKHLALVRQHCREQSQMKIISKRQKKKKSQRNPGQKAQPELYVQEKCGHWLWQHRNQWWAQGKLLTLVKLHYWVGDAQRHANHWDFQMWGPSEGSGSGKKGYFNGVVGGRRVRPALDTYRQNQTCSFYRFPHSLVWPLPPPLWPCAD